MGHHQLDSLDEQILRLIAGNARIPFLRSPALAMFQGQPFTNAFRN